MDGLAFLFYLPRIRGFQAGYVSSDKRRSVRPNLKGDKVMRCDKLKAEPMIINDDYTALYYLKESVDAAIDELKEKIDGQKWRGDEWARAANDKEKQIAELKAKLEDVQATAYAESVDAGMENRRLKRALWLARANDASSFAGLFSTLSYIENDGSRTYWIFGNKRKKVFDGLKCSRMETAYKWFCIWDDVANICLKKAEEYK
jgi:hypothetical protein